MSEPNSSSSSSSCITLWDLARWQWREALLFMARVAIFWGLQTMSNELVTSHHGLVVFAYGWLLLASTRFMWGMGIAIWRWIRWPQSVRLWHLVCEQFDPYDAMCDAGILNVALSTLTEEEEEEDGEEAQQRMLSALSFCDDVEPPPAQQHPPPPAVIVITSQPHPVIPWTAWAAAHASGCALFVLSYGLSGLFWLPQYALLLSMLGLLLLVRAPAHAFFVQRAQQKRRLRSRAFGIGLLLMVVLILGTLFWHEPRAHRADIAPHLWLGVLLPLITLTYMMMAPPPHARAEGVDAFVTLSMPTMAMLSVTVLSLLSSSTTSSTPAAAHTTSSSSLVVIGVKKDEWSDAQALFMNASRTYYSASTRMYEWIGVSPLPIPDTALGMVALGMAPSLLWVSVIIILRAMLRRPSRIGSTLAAYVLALLLMQKTTSPMLLSSWNLLLCVLFPCVLMLVWVPELRTLEERRRRTHSSVVALYSPDMLVVVAPPPTTPPPSSSEAGGSGASQCT
jgi:hypothetical protein